MNAALGALFARLLAPLDALPPLAGLAIVSLVTTVPLLLVFRRMSNQPRLARVKRRIHACIFECRLFQDDLPAVFRALGELLRHNAAYLALSLLPLLWMAVPFALVLPQLDLHFGYRGAVGEPLLLTARVASEAGGAGPSATLSAPDGVRVLTPAVWIPATRELLWRVEAARPGAYTLVLRVGGSTIEKTLSASAGVSRRSPVRPGSGVVEQAIHPAEPPVPAGSPVSEIRVGYAERNIELLGGELPWIVPYFVFSLGWGLLLKRPLRVTI